MQHRVHPISLHFDAWTSNLGPAGTVRRTPCPSSRPMPRPQIDCLHGATHKAEMGWESVSTRLLYTSIWEPAEAARIRSPAARSRDRGVTAQQRDTQQPDMETKPCPLDSFPPRRAGGAPLGGNRVHRISVHLGWGAWWRLVRSLDPAAAQCRDRGEFEKPKSARFLHASNWRRVGMQLET